MSTRENELSARKSLRFNGEEIMLAVKLIDKIESTMEVIYYLMEHEDAESFVLMLLSAENVETESVLEKEKRDTDIIFEIDKEKSYYVMLCQDTKVDGGYRFAERVIDELTSNGGKNVFCTEIEVRSTRNKVKFVIFKLIETFVKSKQENRVGEIIYKSLS